MPRSPAKSLISTVASPPDRRRGGRLMAVLPGPPDQAASASPPRPLILSSYGRAVVTAMFMALLGWLVIETQGGSDLGLAERLFLSIETCWPFIVAVALRQTTG
jgi:hypothetical protein